MQKYATGFVYYVSQNAVTGRDGIRGVDSNLHSRIRKVTDVPLAWGLESEPVMISLKVCKYGDRNYRKRMCAEDECGTAQRRGRFVKLPEAEEPQIRSSPAENKEFCTHVRSGNQN